jgi:alkylation response protein AidB-like acyl-CoA dehydrogenase
MTTALSLEDRDSLAGALRKALQERYGFAAGRRQAMNDGPDRLPRVSQLLTELGLSGLMLPESAGGFGGAVVDMQRVQRELGRSLVVCPWFDTWLGAQVVLRAGGQEALLAAVSAGSISMALAVQEDSGVGQSEAPLTSARPEGGVWCIDGVKTCVFHAGAVDRLLVHAAVADAGETWFLVSPDQPGVRQLRSYRLVDGNWAADLKFVRARAEGLAAPVPGDPLAGIGGAIGLLAAAGRNAELLGGCEAALELTVQHLRTRSQFGQSLGEYQALRHRVAEMYIALEQIRSAAEMASEAMESFDRGEAASALRRSAQARLVAFEAAAWMLQQAIQLHGGMGMTEELAIGHYYRRLLVLQAVGGGASDALASLMAKGA